MRSSIMTAAIAVALGTISFSAIAQAQDATPQDATPQAAHHHKARHHSVRHVAAAPAVAGLSADVAAELASRDNEIAELKSAMSNLESKVASLEERTDAQSDINVSTQQNVEKLQSDAPKVDKIAKLVNDTTISGRVFVDISDMSVKKNGVKTAATGDGLDVKRAYISVTHNFNDIWSGNITTDFNYVSADSETQLFIKKAYLQGKFSDAFIFRAGSADTPWIPFVESFYGFRYVENTLVDKQKLGNSADWGVNVNGVVDGTVNYSASLLDGGGYKNPTRTKRMDFEGRVGFAPFDGAMLAVGGYSGTLGKETQLVDALHTADRVDFLAAYAKNSTRVGFEYYQANNWGQVLSPLKDKADGYSLWGSYGISDLATLFARYDHSKPSKDLDPALTEKYFNFGLEWAVSKGLKVSAVYKNDDLKDLVNDTKTQEFGIFGDVSF